MRSYSDTTSTTSSDEEYGYYGGKRYGRKYATLAASSVSRRRARSRSDRFYETHRNLLYKDDSTSNDCYNNTRENKNTYRDINKLTTAAFTEALKKHFSSIGRQQQGNFHERKSHGVEGDKLATSTNNVLGDKNYQVMTESPPSSAVSVNRRQGTRRSKRKQKYYHKSSESILQSTPSCNEKTSAFEDLPPELPPRNRTNHSSGLPNPPPIPLKPSVANQKPSYNTGKSEYAFGHLSEGEALSMNKKKGKHYTTSREFPLQTTTSMKTQNSPREPYENRHDANLNKNPKFSSTSNPEEFSSLPQPHQQEDGYFTFSAKKNQTLV